MERASLLASKLWVLRESRMTTKEPIKRTKIIIHRKPLLSPRVWASVQARLGKVFKSHIK